MTVDDDQYLQPKPVATPVRAQAAAPVESIETGSHGVSPVERSDEGKRGDASPVPVKPQDSEQSEMKEESKNGEESEHGDGTSVLPKKDTHDDDVDQAKEVSRKAWHASYCFIVF